MPEVLQANGISWKVYNPPGSDYQPGSPVAMLVSDNILLYFKQYSDPASALYKNAFSPVYPTDFCRDVTNDALPSVSWIVSPVLPKGLDEHPPAPSALGEFFTHQVLSTIVSNPKVWAKTVLFITHDENDGFFDHLRPHTPHHTREGEFLTVDPLPADANGIAGPIGLGFRVPMLVVSPFSTGGLVCSETFDHTSQLRFLEARFGVEVPNLSRWRRKVTGNLVSTLHDDYADTSVPTLPPTPENDPRIARECQPLQLLELNVAVPPYPLPSVQQMPSQEPGQPRRVHNR